MSLKTKLILGFLIISLVTCCLGVVTLQTYGGIKKDFQSLHKNILPGEATVMSLQATLSSLMTNLDDLISNNSDAKRQIIMRDTSNLMNNTKQYLARERLRNNIDKTDAAELETRIRHIALLSRQISSAAQVGSARGEALYRKSNVRLDLNVIMPILEDQAARHKQELLVNKGKISNYYEAGSFFVWIFIMTSLLLALVLGYVFSYVFVERASA
jgi:hypothetical protein